MKLLYSFIKDVKLSLKSFYFYLEIIMALIFVVVLLFVVPENFNTTITVYGVMDLDSQVKEQMLTLLEEEDEMDFQLFDTMEEVQAAMAKNRSSIGISIAIDAGKVNYEYILQGYESEKFKNIMKATIEQADFAEKMAGYESVVTLETLDTQAEKLSDRLNILPVILVMNASFMGLFIIASYVFMDKDEGTIRAFAVTPARVWQYLLSKIGVMLMTGIASGLVVAIFVAGLKVHYIHFLVLLIATNIFGSVLGLFIASYFDTMIKAMGALFMAILTMALSSLAFYNPAFSPLILRILPSYPMIFAFREVLLDNCNVGYVYSVAALFSLISVPLFFLTNHRFKKTITV